MLRLIHDPPLDGPSNMARDEALMLAVGERAAPPTLRLYAWSAPNVSLGFFQRYADYLALPPPAGTLPVVRRLTGGGAILHDLEFTYSLSLPLGHELLRDGPNRLYERAHDAVIAALGEFRLHTARCGDSDGSGAARGPFFCFERRHCHDVLLGEKKIAGSAQRRTRHAVLQHGSIILGSRFSQHPAARSDAPDVQQAIAQTREAFARHLPNRLGVDASPQPWPDGELQRANALIPKYAGAEWTRRT
jgi:lipoate-protein ligase A